MATVNNQEVKDAPNGASDETKPANKKQAAARSRAPKKKKPFSYTVENLRENPVSLGAYKLSPKGSEGSKVVFKSMAQAQAMARTPLLQNLIRLKWVKATGNLNTK